MKKKFRIITSFLCAFLIVSLVILANYKSKAFADDAFEVGTTNLNNTAENSAKVWDYLSKPEKGWSRYNDTNDNISYIGTWPIAIRGYYYKGDQHSTDFPKDTAKFNFTGTKLRIMGAGGSDKSNNVHIAVDGTVTNVNMNNNYGAGVLVFEKLNLSSGEHSVVLTNDSTIAASPTLIIDAIDIDQNGTLKPYSEIKSIAVSGISLNKTTDSLEVNKTDTLTATVTPDNATNKTVKWTSSDTSIVTVDPDTGKITAGSTPGTATITATAQDGSKISASCIVTVTKGSDPTPTPTTDDSDKAALNVTMTNGQVKQYNIDMSEINKFISWYKLRLSGSGEPFYEFDITQSSSSNIKKTDYVIYDKISSFEVDDYTK